MRREGLIIQAEMQVLKICCDEMGVLWLNSPVNPSFFMKKPWIFALLALVVGALGGFISGKNMASGNAPSAAEKQGAVRDKVAVERSTFGASRQNARAKRPLNIGQISSMPGSTQRVQAMLDFYSNLSISQFEREAGKLDQLPMNERLLASFLLFGRWAELDPTAAMAYSGSMGFGGMFVKPTILRGWASVDPTAAAAYLADHPREFAMMGAQGGGPMSGRGGASIIASEWARKDPAAAMTWAKSLGDGRAEAISAVVEQVAKLDPTKASQMLAGIGGDDVSEAFQSVARFYGAKNFEEAQAWINSLPLEQRDDALAAAIGGLSSDDAAAAAVAQVRLMSQGAAKDRVVAEVVGDIARDDPKWAADFLKEQGSDEAKRMSMRELMSSWVNKDAANALSYAFALEAGDVRDSALQAYVMTNSAADPSQVILVAENIQDEGERIRSMSIAATRWMREDAAAARVYVEESQLLPEADKNRILNGGGWFGGRFGGQRGAGAGGSR